MLDKQIVEKDDHRFSPVYVSVYGSRESPYKRSVGLSNTIFTFGLCYICLELRRIVGYRFFYSYFAVLLHSCRSIPKICTTPFLRYFSAEHGDLIERESMDYDVVIVGVVFWFPVIILGWMCRIGNSNPPKDGGGQTTEGHFCMCVRKGRNGRIPHSKWLSLRSSAIEHSPAELERACTPFRFC